MAAAERERTVVATLLDSSFRAATKTRLDLLEKEEVVKEAAEEGERPKPRRRRNKRTDFSAIADARNSTELTQLQLAQLRRVQGSWSQRLYQVVCGQLRLRPRQYVHDALANRHLTLANKFSTSQEILSIAVSLTDNDALTAVTIVDNKLDTSSITYLCQALWQNRTVTSLTVAGNELTDKGLGHLVELLTQTRHLQSVSLRDNRIRDAHGPLVARLLLHNTSVTHLDLSYNQLGDQAAVHIGPALADNDSVRSLNLNWNCFRAAGARLLAKDLGENIALRELTLQMNGLGVEGAGYVAKYLAGNDTLFCIDLSGNRISDFGFDLLAKAVAKNSTLKEIRLGSNTVTTAGVLLILEAFQRNVGSALRILSFEGLYLDKKCLELIEQIKLSRSQAIIFEMHGTVESGTEHKRKEMIRGIIDHDSPLEILRFYVEQTGSRLVDVFNVFDADKKNAITKSDLTRGLEKLNVVLTQEQVDILFEELDTDKSGDIDFGELMAGDREARKNLRRKGKFKAAQVKVDATPDFADI